MKSTHAEQAPPLTARLPGRAEVESAQRTRLMRAMLETAGELGYGRAVVAEVIARAGVSRKTFYAHFRDREECFAAAYDAYLDAFVAQLALRDRGLSARELLRATLEPYLEGLAADPLVARAMLVEIYAAGSAIRSRRGRVFDRFGAIFREVHERLAAEQTVRSLTDFDFVALVGAVAMVATMEITAGRTEELPRLRPDLERFVLDHLLA